MRIRSALVVLCLLAGPASAQSWRDREWRSVRVDVSALDLSTPAGMEVLEGRLARAVSRVCGSDRDCRDEAWASTEDQVAWAIDRDRWMRRMAEERMAQLEARRWRDCDAPQPARYPVAPPPAPTGAVTVVIVQGTAPPVVYRY